MKFLEITVREPRFKDARMSINPATIINVIPDAFDGTLIALLPDGGVVKVVEHYNVVMAELEEGE